MARRYLRSGHSFAEELLLLCLYTSQVLEWSDLFGAVCYMSLAYQGLASPYAIFEAVFQPGDDL